MLPNGRLPVGVGHGIKQEGQAAAGDAGQDDVPEDGEQGDTEHKGPEPPHAAGGETGGEQRRGLRDGQVGRATPRLVRDAG
jgi:hypothetical protein